MDTSAWIQLGVLCIAMASAAGAVVRFIGKKVDQRFDKIDTHFDKIDFQFSKVELKFDQQGRQFNERFDRLREISDERHISNVERMARIEGQISALPQKIDTSGPKPGG